MNPTKLERQVNAAAGLLKAASNPLRLLILCHLTDGEKSVGELEGQLAMRQPHLSQHLARLRRDGLVRTRRASRTIYYELASEEAAKLINLLYDMYCSEKIGARKKPIKRAVRDLPRRTALVDREVVGV